MNRRSILFLATLIVLLGLLNLIVVVFAQGNPLDSSPEIGNHFLLEDTAFYYQGLLEEGNSSADGDYDFRFTVYDASNGGNTIGSQLTKSNVAVEDGLFTVKLDFGMNIFTGEPRYLQIHVRPSSGGTFDPLSPRQQLLPVPYALHAGQVPWSGITDIPPDLNLEYPISSRQNLSINTVDAGVENSFIAMTTGIDGLALIAYTDTSQNLKVAHCDNYLCSAVTTTQIDTNIADRMGITIGVDGLPIISYANNLGDLKVAHCINRVCSTSSLVTISAVTTVTDARLTIGSDGLPIIVVTATGASSDGVVHCDDMFCNSATFSNINSINNDASIVIRGNGRPFISYLNNSSAHRVYRCTIIDCSSGIDSGVGASFETSYVSLLSNGFPVIAGETNFVVVILCQELSCATREDYTVLSTSTTRRIAVTIGSDGLPIGSYLSNSGPGLGFFHIGRNCSAGSCTNNLTSFDLDELALSSNDGYLGMTVDGDGFTLIAVTDDSNTLYLVRTIVGRGQRTP